MLKQNDLTCHILPGPELRKSVHVASDLFLCKNVCGNMCIGRVHATCPSAVCRSEWFLRVSLGVMVNGLSTKGFSLRKKNTNTKKKNSAGSRRGIQSRKASKRCTENVHFKVVTYEDEHNSEHCSAHVFDTYSLPRRIFRRDSMLCITACLHHCIAHCTAHSNIARKTESLHRGIQALTALAKASQPGQWSSSATLGTLGVHSLPFIAQLARP